MKRALWLIVLAILVMAATVWLADRPGTAVIHWQGWRIETSVGFLVLALAALVAVASIAYRAWRGILGAPRSLARRRRERRRRRGYVALTQGLVAVAAGDPAAARRHARRADYLLGDPPLTMLLSAQVAQLDGDEETAKAHFTAMLGRPETAFLGLRGLLMHAIRTGDRATALELARRAQALKPNTPWVLSTLIELETQAGQWAAVAHTLDHAKQAGVLPAAQARRQRAAALVELSRTMLAEGRPRDAVVAAERAHRAEPDHPAAGWWLARCHADTGKPRAAIQTVEREWPRHPHPDLLAVYRAARAPASPAQWLKQVEALAARAPDRVESLAALGEAALEAGLWGEARRHIERAVAAANGEPAAGLCRLAARLEESESGDPAALRGWLDRAMLAPPDPAWVCDSCGSVQAEWLACCPRCGAFDRFAWRAPNRVAATPALAEALVVEGNAGPMPLASAEPTDGGGRSAGLSVPVPDSRRTG